MFDTQIALQLREAMWQDPFVQQYQDAALPSRLGRSIFLAGPTTRGQILEKNWRIEAVYLLRMFGYKGWIFVPEPRGIEQPGDFTEKESIHRWESTRLAVATKIIFWIPRDDGELLGLNTNLELGMCLGPPGAPLPEAMRSRLYIGWPGDAARMGLPRHYLKEKRITPYHNLAKMCNEVVFLPPKMD